jgi:hypothetical protein
MSTLKSQKKFIKRKRQTITTLAQTFGGVRSALGPPSRDFFEPDQKLLPSSPNFEKNIALAFLKVA